MNSKRKFPLWAKIAIPIAAVIIILALSVVIYSADYYSADSTAMEAMSYGVTSGDYTVFEGGGEVGFIFYPGGKVEHSAYAPLMQSLAERGITCVLAEMPLKLAVLDSDAYKGAKECAPNVTRWYIGGHSLGGAMAASVSGEGDFAGLVLLAAYPTDGVNIPALSVFGSLDGVMNREKYAEGLEHFASDFEEIIIEGGNHAGFGMYGEQKGDGTALITSEEQIELTAAAIRNFIK